MRTCLALALVAFLTAPAFADTFADATGEGSIVSGNAILDITSVEVTNTATDITFKINLAGNPVATDWGKYMIGIDSVAGGDVNGDGWRAPIKISSGMDSWLGSWADSGNGVELWKYTGSWTLADATYAANPDNISVIKDASSITLKTNLAGLGLASGGTFTFDVYTSGGGGTDSAIDAVGNASQTVANWGDAYDSGTNVKSFTVVVPEPAALGLLAVGALGLLRRRSR